MGKYWPDNHDAFASSPFLAILPSFGGTQRGKTLVSSLYARFEKVSARIGALDRDNEEELRRLSAEKLMLENVLDWLKVKAGNQEGE